MVIETSGESVKYMYNGISLSQYCLNNKINITTIKSRIKILKKSNPKLNDNELVTIAIEEYYTKKEKALINYVSDKTNPYDNIEKKEFSSKMMSVLSNLEKEDLSFVILRFQENYSYEELSDYLGISKEEVIQKEMELLSKLKENDNIKVLSKQKKN